MNEFELIEKITHGAPQSGQGLIRGIGDDCAVIDGFDGKNYLVTTDSLFEGVHFDLKWISPLTLGRKALSVNVSDVSAMGGKPLFYLVSIGVQKGSNPKEIASIFDGMAQVARNYRMALIGGDTCRSEKGLVLSLTVIGEIDKGKEIYRNGAKVGDVIYVTGTIGDSSLGLVCIEKGMNNMETRSFIKKHNDPTPRVSCGQWLSSSTCVTAMIDVSDGLAQDLGHIADDSNIGIKIFADKIPYAKDFAGICNSCHKDPLTLALAGGEDYELAFTVAKDKVNLFEKMLNVVLPTFGHSVTKIGEVIEDNGVHVIDMHGHDVILESAGFEHRF